MAAVSPAVVVGPGGGHASTQCISSPLEWVLMPQATRAKNRNPKWYRRDLEVFLFENVRAGQLLVVHPCVPDTRCVYICTYAETKSHLRAARIGSFVCSTFFGR